MISNLTNRMTCVSITHQERRGFMEDRIANLIYDYSVNKKLADTHFIEQLVAIIIGGKELNPYFTKLEFDSNKIDHMTQDVVVARYIPENQVLNISLDGIRLFLKESSDLEYLFNDTEKNFYGNVLITQIILREIEHINQLKIIDCNDGIESDILKLSKKSVTPFQKNNQTIQELLRYGYTMQQIDFYMKEKQRMYLQNYALFPHERLAEIKSNVQLKNILKSIKSSIPHLMLFEEIKMLENMLRGYTDHLGIVISPTIQYLSVCGLNKELRNFAWYDDNYTLCLEKNMRLYNLPDRASYGLPIHINEFHSIQEGIQHKLSILK